MQIGGDLLVMMIQIPTVFLVLVGVNFKVEVIEFFCCFSYDAVELVAGLRVIDQMPERLFNHIVQNVSDGIL